MANYIRNNSNLHHFSSSSSKRSPNINLLKTRLDLQKAIKALKTELPKMDPIRAHPLFKELMKIHDK